MKDFKARVIVREDTYSGLLAAGGNLYIGRETTLAAHRVDALLQHEVGTHLVTYYNGPPSGCGGGETALRHWT